MLHRAEACCNLPPEQQAAYYYGAGLDGDAFCAAVAAGDAAAVAHALDVLAAAHWLRPRDRARYGSRMRDALYVACARGLLTPQHKRLFSDVEYSLMLRLMTQAYHTEPGAAAQRAQRRLKAVLEPMQRRFGELPLYVDFDDWPPVPAPTGLLRRAVRRGWFTAGQAALLADGAQDILMRFLHGAQAELPAFKPVVDAARPGDTPCYFFCETTAKPAVWVVAPYRELSERCGLILAADGSFCYLVDDWGDIYGCE